MFFLNLFINFYLCAWRKKHTFLLNKILVTLKDYSKLLRLLEEKKKYKIIDIINWWNFFKYNDRQNYEQCVVNFQMPENEWHASFQLISLLSRYEFYGIVIYHWRIFFQAWGLQTNFIPRGENLSITSQNRLRIETGTNRLLFFFNK